jgi:hypothetical protein
VARRLRGAGQQSGFSCVLSLSPQKQGDTADRAYLESLSNLDRETLLAERFAQRKERIGASL